MYNAGDRLGPNGEKTWLADLLPLNRKLPCGVRLGPSPRGVLLRRLSRNGLRRLQPRNPRCRFRLQR